jgi:hypothetical protein
MQLLIVHFLHPPVTSSLLGPDIVLSTLFLNTLKLCSSLRQVSRPHETTYFVYFILIFRFSERSRKKDFLLLGLHLDGGKMIVMERESHEKTCIANFSFVNFVLNLFPLP